MQLILYFKTWVFKIYAQTIKYMPMQFCGSIQSNVVFFFTNLSWNVTVCIKTFPLSFAERLMHFVVLYRLTCLPVCKFFPADEAFHIYPYPVGIPLDLQLQIFAIITGMSCPWLRNTYLSHRRLNERFPQRFFSRCLLYFRTDFQVDTFLNAKDFTLSMINREQLSLS